jgi:hypothetical protein
MPRDKKNHEKAGLIDFQVFRRELCFGAMRPRAFHAGLLLGCDRHSHIDSESQQTALLRSAKKTENKGNHERATGFCFV